MERRNQAAQCSFNAWSKIASLSKRGLHEIYVFTQAGERNSAGSKRGRGKSAYHRNGKSVDCRRSYWTLLLRPQQLSTHPSRERKLVARRMSAFRLSALFRKSCVVSESKDMVPEWWWPSISAFGD